jgi:predicted dehydrogenase
VSRIGLIGCGAWGRHILRDLTVLGCDVTVVARSPASVERARAGGAAEIVGAVSALGELDGAVVATPTVTHTEVVGSLLDREIPIFCEKPLCADAQDARDLASAASGRLFVMDKWRYHHGIEALAAIARSGELGAVHGIVSVREQWGNPHRDVDSVWIHLPHDLAIGLEILGHLPPPRSAVAELVDGDAIGLHGLLGAAPWLLVSHSAAAPATRRLVRLVCEHGTATLGDGYDEALAISRGAPERGREPERRPIDPEWPLLRELRAFVEHVRGGPPPRSGAAEHVEIVERLAALRVLAGLDGDASDQLGP